MRGDTMASTGNWVIDTLNDSLSRWGDTLTQIVELLSQSPENLAGSGWSVVSSIHGSLQAIANALLVLFFCVGAFKSMGTFADMKRPEPAFKMFLRFLLAKLAITHSMDIMRYIFTIAQGVMRTISGSLSSITGSISALPDDVVQAINNTSFIESIPLWFISLIASIIVIALSFMLLFTIYGRFFKVYMYIAIAPIPLSTFGGDASSHFAKSFLKSFAGVCLQGAIILLACVIFNHITLQLPQTATDGSSSAFTILWNFILPRIANMALLVLTIKVSDQVTKEMMGL